MEGNFLRLLVVLLCFSSHLIFLNAVPTTRTKSLMAESQVHGVSENTHLETTEELSLEVEKFGIRRVDVELNDYPGSGANNRHTPYPRPGRSGCVDC